MPWMVVTLSLDMVTRGLGTTLSLTSVGTFGVELSTVGDITGVSTCGGSAPGGGDT